MTDEEDEVTPKIEVPVTNKRKSLGIRSSPAVVNENVVENIEVTKSEDNTKFVVTLPDGSNVNVIYIKINICIIFLFNYLKCLFV